MARARNIKPGFFKNEDLAECSAWARLCFAGLWTLADREGRLEDRPKRIKGELFAFDTVEVDPLLIELEGRGFLVRYRNSDGAFIQISKFSAHQTPHYSEKPSVIKPPGFQEQRSDEGGSTPRALRDDSKSAGSIKRGAQPPDSLNPDSLNPEEENSSSSTSAERTATPTIPCPYDAIVDAYHRELPTLPKVRLRDGPTWKDRQKAMRGLWGWVLSSRKSGDGSRRAETAEEAIAWITGYFARASQNDFVMGRTGRGAGHENWCCDFDFLLSKNGMKQVIEKTQEHAA